MEYYSDHFVVGLGDQVARADSGSLAAIIGLVLVLYYMQRVARNLQRPAMVWLLRALIGFATAAAGYQVMMDQKAQLEATDTEGAPSETTQERFDSTQNKRLQQQKDLLKQIQDDVQR